MKKSVVFIYDCESEKLIQIGDVRDLTPEQFASLNKDARKNRLAKIKADQKKIDDRMEEIARTFNFYAKKIDGLQKVVAHLLGLKEFDDETIKKLIEFNNQKSVDELEHPTIDEPAEIVEPNESEEESNE